MYVYGLIDMYLNAISHLKVKLSMQISSHMCVGACVYLA